LKNDTYKGFETWWNGIRMSMKMYIYVFIIFFVLQIFLTIGVSYFMHSQKYTVFARYIIGVLKLNRSPDMSMVSEYLTYFFWQNLSLFVASSIIYFAYPFTIGIFKARSNKQSSTKYVSGAGEVSNDEFVSKIGPGDLPIGSFRLPIKEENKHCLAIGRPGTGKTVFISQVVEGLIKRNAKAVIYDSKGDYTERFYDPERDVLFNPLDARCTGWCIFDDIKTKLDINNVASSLIPPTYSGESFWHDGARAVLSGILHHLWQHDTKTNQNIWGGVSASGVKIHSWLSKIPEGLNGLRYIEDHSSKQAIGVLSTMMQYTAVFEYMAQSTRNFSITEWLENKKPGFIFVTNQADTQETLRPVLSLFIDFLGKKLLSLSDDLNRRVFFLLDEFGSLQRLSSITQLLIASRSKGGSIWLGIQDMGQLKKLYTHDTATTIVNACGTSVMFAVADPDTAQYLIRKIGDTEILETEETLSMGVSNYRDGVSMTQRRKRQPLLLNSQLMNLPDLCAYAKVPNNSFITLTRFQLRDYKKKTVPFVIRPDLMLQNIVQKQQLIQADVQNITGEDLFDDGITDKGTGDPSRSISQELDVSVER
jgi:type IV secretory pathway TraG/TraD family ATPase VirD4